ncbi:cysteine hydrolase family protein [Streptomyces sp. PSAA01]|uniref:cysteine hydrolase family protein n=1 Tax=Streptomyces sp. PSAA01 TaxID=2912762 RepID=UPI002351F561|nr:cysteine hydrolase [Streptomyces sp. PSAA01]
MGAPRDRPGGAPCGLLAVIDMQRVFADPRSPWASPRFGDAAEGVRRLLPLFGERVVFTRFLAPDKPVGSWRAYYEQWPFARQPPDAPLWELTDEFGSPAPVLVDATTFGKWTPELAELVGHDGRLVLAGVSTDCCVLSTALAAADAGVEVVVVADACAGSDDASHAMALRMMRLYGPLIRTVSVDEMLTGATSTP